MAGTLDPEFAINQERRCPLILLLDTSSSMKGNKIDLLNKSVNILRNDLIEDELASLRVEIAIIKFGGEKATLVQEFSNVDNFVFSDLETSGLTPMGSAVDLALDLLDQRKNIYKKNAIKSYCPWIFMLTDGYPTDKGWENAAKRIKEQQNRGKIIFFAVGVSDFNKNKLMEFCTDERPPVSVHESKFAEMFIWISKSMKSFSNSQKGDEVDLPPAGWISVVS